MGDRKEGDEGIQVVQLGFVLAKIEPVYVEAAYGVVPAKILKFLLFDLWQKQNLERYIIYDFGHT